MSKLNISVDRLVLNDAVAALLQQGRTAAAGQLSQALQCGVAVPDAHVIQECPYCAGPANWPTSIEGVIAFIGEECSGRFSTAQDGAAGTEEEPVFEISAGNLLAAFRNWGLTQESAAEGFSGVHSQPDSSVRVHALSGRENSAARNHMSFAT